MSEEKKTTQLAVLQPKLAALDQFAEENSLAVLTEGKGAFTAAIQVADAIGQLKAMLTEDVMKPIMALQGTALGFKTDADKNGGYPLEVVRDCFIEGTLKGFKFVANQSNIIGGRWYATKEGFEEWFARQGRLGKITDLKVELSVPKIISENEAHVTASVTWKKEGTGDGIKPNAISIRVNKGQGADAILGKARRKILAQAYARITGTIVTDGSVDEAEPINVEARTVVEGSAGDVKVASDEQKQLLKEIVGDKAEKVNAYLVKVGSIKPGQTYTDLKPKAASSIIGNPKAFMAAVEAN